MKYKRVPRRVRLLGTSGSPTPSGMASGCRSTSHSSSTVRRRIAWSACYPSPAGATESLLPLDTWDEIVAANPVLATLEPDVEALLANRVVHARDAGPAEYYVAPADQCFRLVGIIRAGWKGLSGGTEVWRDIAQFFDSLKVEAGVKAGGVRA